MILAVQIDRAISIADLIPVKVRNSYTDIRHHAGGGVRRIEGRQHVGHGLAQNINASRSLDRISHRTGGIQHEDHVHALAHGNAGGRQFDLGHAGILEIDALAGLFHTNRTLVGILGIVVQLCLIPHDHRIGNAAHRHRGSTCRKAFEGHRGAGRNSRRGGWVVVDRDVGGGIFPICLLTDLGHTRRATSIAPSVSILIIVIFFASLGIQMVIIAVISLIVVTSILPASVFFLNQCVTGDIGLRSGCLAVLPLRAVDRNRDRRRIGARIRRLILTVNGLGSGLTDIQVNGLSRGLRRLGGALGGQLIDVHSCGCAGAVITVNQTAAFVVVQLPTTVGEADQMGSVEIQAEGGACIFEGGGDGLIVGVRQLDLLRTVAQQPASAAAHKLPFLCLILTGNRCGTAGGNIGSLKIHACALAAAAVGLGDNFRQNELRTVINQQILVTADQFTLTCHQSIGPLCGFNRSCLCDVIGAEMIGGKCHLAVRNICTNRSVVTRLIDHYDLAGSVKAIRIFQRNRYSCRIPLGISRRRNVVRDIGGILACINGYSIFRCPQTGQARCGNRHIASGYGCRRCDCGQLDGLRTFIYCRIGVVVSALIFVTVRNAR